MSNRYEDDGAEYLMVNKANDYKGFTAAQITEALALPTNTAYRVLRRTGFYKSTLPRWPCGYYYDANKALNDMRTGISAVHTAEIIVDKAKSQMREATFTQKQVTPLGLVLSQTKSIYEDDILKTVGTMVAPKVYTIQEIKDKINSSQDIENLKTWLILCLVAANRNMIVSDNKFGAGL